MTPEERTARKQHFRELVGEDRFAQLTSLIGKSVRIVSKAHAGYHPEAGHKVPLAGEIGTVLDFEPEDGACVVRIDTGPCAGKHVGLHYRADNPEFV